MNSQNLGTAGEQLAARFLQKQGMKILERNVRTRLGEIDLVCRDGDTIVFVEVKTRSSNRYGSGSEAVGIRKQNRLVRLAQAYLGSRQLESTAVRFDVVSVQLAAGQPSIEHIPGAFQT